MFARPRIGSVAPATLSSGPHSRSLSVSKPVLGTACLSNQRVTGLRPSVRQAHSLVAGQSTFACTDPEPASVAALVQGVTSGHLDHDEGLAFKFPMVDVDAQGGFDAVGAYFDHQVAERRHLFLRHPLKESVIRHAQQEHAAVRVGERDHFVRQIVAGGTGRAATRELDLLELPPTVFAQPEPLPDVLVPHRHSLPPSPRR